MGVTRRTRRTTTVLPADRLLPADHRRGGQVASMCANAACWRQIYRRLPFGKSDTGIRALQCRQKRTPSKSGTACFSCFVGPATGGTAVSCTASCAAVIAAVITTAHAYILLWRQFHIHNKQHSSNPCLALKFGFPSAEEAMPVEEAVPVEE